MSLSSDAPRTDHSRTSQHRSIQQMIEANLASYWLCLGTTPNGSIHISDELSWEYSGGQYFNRVVDAHLTEETVDRRINEIKRVFQTQKAAITWLLGPSVDPPDLGEHLVNQGFSRQESWLGMACRLDELGEQPTLPEGVDVREVRNESDYLDWIDVVGRSFRFPASAKRLLLASLRSNRLREDGVTLNHFIAYLYGNPVAASTLFISEGVAGIYLVSTVPEVRGIGLGSLITTVALNAARKSGCRIAVLQATMQARRMYERLGFKRYCEIGVYRYDAPSPAWKQFARAGLRRLRRAFRNSNRPRLHASEPVVGEVSDTWGRSGHLQ